MNHSHVSAAGSIVTAAVASLCCIGPVAVSLIGIGGIGLLAGFDAYRPLFIALTIMLLGVAFWMTYRKREVLCKDGSCRVQKAGLWNRISVWGATAIAAITLAFPSLGITPVSVKGTNSSVVVADSATVVYVIEGMDCPACATGIENTLNGTDGIISSHVDYDTEHATVTYDPGRIDVRTIQSVIDETGYRARGKP